MSDNPVFEADDEFIKKAEERLQQRLDERDKLLKADILEEVERMTDETPEKPEEEDGDDVKKDVYSEDESVMDLLRQILARLPEPARPAPPGDDVQLDIEDPSQNNSNVEPVKPMAPAVNKAEVADLVQSELKKAMENLAATPDAPAPEAPGLVPQAAVPSADRAKMYNMSQAEIEKLGRERMAHFAKTNQG